MRAAVGALLAVLALMGRLPAGAAEPDGDLRGWRYLADRLVTDGLPPERVDAVFRDPRVDPFTGLRFSLAPREPRSLYRGFLSSANLARARRCRDAHRELLATVERERGVSASVVTAILFVESGCGRNTGSWVILPRLARLAMAAEPANLAENVARQVALDPKRPAADLERRTRARAQWLWDTFYPEVRATFALADRLGVEPLALRGSISGALGVPQFLPSHVITHGRDGDGDGRVSVFDTEDAIASCADYLAARGWRPGLSAAERRSVIWEYNHSQAYIDTVLALAARLAGQAPPAVRRAGSRPAPVRGRRRPGGAGPRPQA